MFTWNSIWDLANQEMIRLLLPRLDSAHEFENTAMPAEAVEQDIEHGELPHKIEIEKAITEWTKDGLWPTISDAARHCIRLRLNAAADLSYLLFDSRQPGNYLLPPQDQTERQVLRWLLMDWWYRHGRIFLAEQHCIHREPSE